MTAKGIFFCFIGFILLTSCRSDFELLRISGDSEKMLEAANKYFEEGDYKKANILYEMIIPYFRGKSQAEEIAYRFAHGHYLSGSHILSSHYFKSFANTYTASSRRKEALYLSAISFYKLSPRYKLDQGDSVKAIEAFQFYINAFPDSPEVPKCNEYIDQLRLKMELKEFDAGKLYFNTRNYSSAIQSLENMLKDFPNTSHAEEARYIIAKASIDWATNSVFTKKEERFLKTVVRCDAYLKKHPNALHKDEILDFRQKSRNELNKIQNG